MWVMVLAVGLLFALVVRLFVWPSESLPATGDAIVVFAGGSGERIEWALELAESGVAPTVVVSRGVNNKDRVRQAERACDAAHPFEVICVTADPDSTRGEAALFGHLATENQWLDLIAVTSDYHLVRASTLLEACHDGTVFRSAASRRRSIFALPKLVMHELGGLAEAILVERNCLPRR